MSESALCDEVIDDRRRRHHVVGSDHADRHDVVRVDDDGLGGHRDHRVEVARGQRVGEVAEIIGEERVDQSPRRAAGECLKRVPLDRRIRLLGVRVGALVTISEVGAEAADDPDPTPSLF